MGTPPGTDTLSTSPVLQLRGVGYVRGGTQILDDVDWTVEETQNWVVLGPNGSGKTTLARGESRHTLGTPLRRLGTGAR